MRPGGQRQQPVFQQDDCAPSARHRMHLAAVAVVVRAGEPGRNMSIKPCMPPYTTWETTVCCWRTIQKGVRRGLLAVGRDSCWSDSSLRCCMPAAPHLQQLAAACLVQQRRHARLHGKLSPRLVRFLVPPAGGSARHHQTETTTVGSTSSTNVPESFQGELHKAMP